MGQGKAVDGGVSGTGEVTLGGVGEGRMGGVGEGRVGGVGEGRVGVTGEACGLLHQEEKTGDSGGEHVCTTITKPTQSGAQSHAFDSRPVAT